MKKLLGLLVGIVLLSACANDPDGFRIRGTISGEVSDGTKVYLKGIDENYRPVSDLDSTTIQNGKFSFEGAVNLPELRYIFIDSLTGNIPVINDKGTIEISAQRDSLSFAKLKGTPQNKLFSGYLEDSRSIGLKAQSISRDVRQAQAEGNSEVFEALREEMFELQEEAKTFELDFVKENTNSLISVFILEKVLAGKVLPESEIKTLLESLSPEIQETPVAKKVKGKLDKAMSTSIGAKAPNFSGPTPSGEELALYDALGKVTILDFWAAWCKPCRVENPNVVRVYEKYHDKGLNIFGVSLDRKAEDWKKAIADDGLAWNHVSNVNYFDEIAQLYNVNGIPATFILDADGVIVAKNLRGPALEAKIAELLR